MTWDVFNLIGTIAFAVSGAIVAMEEAYDLFGVFVLAMVTAFGGGLIRNVLIGLPVSHIWAQGTLFTTAFLATAVLIILPATWIQRWLRWNFVFDAIGLSAFAIQGALYAAGMRYSLGTIVVAAVMTGIGGGIVRDVLAGRKPLVLRDEIYALWAVLAGFAVGMRWVGPSQPWGLYGLLVAVSGLRVLSVLRGWRIPRRSLRPSRTPIPDVDPDDTPTPTSGAGPGTGDASETSVHHGGGD
ncbi:trimeric intracellular cation channel family protein [Alicyclobacillus sp.]|uniref:trimeric intracellular cation channel family protein n=1 Tax=Alicyclobacillus sp. TaxID=61169 RepID=UPI0025BE9392|nr:trimeric intracellular cation channel family protein [Alicyclobacillus sp.]MCL6516131.1 trimeric intracellular cation channel family protein [Alicyclobacillus sp.]